MTAALQAEAAAVQRLLNAYLRETGIVPGSVRSTSAGPGPRAVSVALPLTRACLAVVPTELSPTGHHRFAPSWWSSVGDGWQPVTGSRVIELIVSEVAAADSDEERRTARRELLLRQISDSVARTACFLTAELCGRVQPPVPGAADAFIAAEQALRTGHPFHPTPKSAEGFDDGDVERFAPELGVAFPLHWLAVDPELTDTVTIDEGADLLPLELVRPEALARLGGRRDDWPLLPVHPWQAAHLERVPHVECLLQEGRLVVLGPLGPTVRPTSSVRTVWDASSRCFMKLPLAVRVTNFVRVNPPEQLARSLHASAVLARVLPHLHLDRLTVLLERGYRGVRPRTLDQEAAQDLLAHTAVVVRDGPDLSRGSPMVVAALLEPSACSGVTPLDRALRSAAAAAARDPAAVVDTWLRRYLDVSLVPLLRLLAEGGVGLEAHTQNSLVTFEDGWPAHLHARDLEGASVDRSHPMAARGYGGVLRPDSPALYETDEVWRRFAYYVVVNQVSDVVAGLARSSGVEEARLWAEVRERLLTLAPQLPGDGRRRVEALVSGPHLPAKANLLSRFAERSEDPLYVAIPNPLRTCVE